ncbi:MAG TPA: MaoC family dehydratase N-terminal domain-containing protein [Casimicrobiaceae bacterium]
MQSLTGREYPPFEVEVEKRWIRSFAAAVGDDDPLYRDEAKARSAGYPSIVAPPTFAFTIAMEARQPLRVLEDLGVDPTRTMHGEQSFRYHRPICAGDLIRGRQRVTAMYDKKGGALTFVVTETALDNQRGERVCELGTTIVVRNG